MLPQEDIHNREFNIRDYVQIAFRRKWIIIIPFIIVILFTIFHNYKTIPIYRATTNILIDDENPTIVSFKEVSAALESRDLMFFETQHMILTSRSLALRVIKSLNLENSVEFDLAKRPKSISITGFLRSLIKGKSQDSGNDKDGEINANQKQVSKSTPGDRNRLRSDERESKLISKYLRKLKVKRIKGSRLVSISFTGYSPEEVKNIVNKHADEYIDYSLESKYSVANDAIKWLQEQVNTKMKMAESAEKALQLYKEKEQLVFIEDSQNIMIQKLKQLSGLLTTAKTERIDLETIYNLVKENEDSFKTLESIPGIMQSGIIQELKREYRGIDVEYNALIRKYGDEHPTMKTLDIVKKVKYMESRLAEEIKKISKSIEMKYEIALAHEQALEKALEEQKGIAMKMSRSSIAYGTLKRNSESEGEMYGMLLKRLKETDLMGGLQKSNVRVIDAAESPRSAVKPDKKKNIIFGLIFGLGIGIGLALVIEYLDNTIKSPDDIEKYLSAPLLGVIEKTSVPVGDSSTTPELIAYETPKSVVAEAIRGIRTGIIFSVMEKNRNLIMITSTIQGEGKTFVASNLSAAFAVTGKKTLLVDVDLRRPRVHKVFNHTNQPGLSNHLIGDYDFESILRPTPVPNLSVITSGDIPPNPSEIMHSTAMEEFCNTVRKKFDIVIFDTPPTMTVTDSMILSRIVDGVVVVIKSGMVARETAKRCISQIKKNEAEIFGVIANCVDITKGSYYYHYYAHYYKYAYTSESEVKGTVRASNNGASLRAESRIQGPEIADLKSFRKKNKSKKT